MSVGTAEDAGRVLGEDAAGPVWLRRFRHALQADFIAQRDRFALWIPVLFGAGIAVYFSVTVEPAPWAGAGAAGASAAAMLVAWRAPGWRLAFFALALAATGFAVAQGRTHAVAAPVLARDFGPGRVTGRVVALDRRPDGTRAILDRPALQGLPADATPARVRIRLRRGDDPKVGDIVRLRAKLAPPAAPAMPGAYDFQRRAWFERIGGVGFAYTHAARAVSAPGAAADSGSGYDLWLARFRLGIADRIRAAELGTAGTVAAALITGDRSAIPEETIAAMRNSGLAHLLAISGLHVGLVAAILFFGIRLVLALVEPVALRLSIKKVAAGGAFAGAFAYLLMSGATVPTQRAFVMTGIVLAAVLLDRTAISLRLVAWAAMLVLLLQPESLMGPSFQMSFAAVLSLVAAYEGLRGPLRRWRAGGGAMRRVWLYLAGLALSTLVAGTATGVIALHHFGRFSAYGLVANLIAIPLAGVWIMPFGVLACVLMPFGLEDLALTPMAWGIDLLLDAARMVAAWPGASVQLPAMPGWGLALAGFGGIWLCLWRGPLRWAGGAGVLAGLLSVALTVPPDILIDGSGRLIAVRTAGGGLSLSSRRVEKFAAQIWLERDGEAGATAWPATESGDGRLTCDSIGCLYRAGGRTVALVRDERAFDEDCVAGAVVVSTVPARWHCRAADRVVDRFDLWRNGAHAIWLGRGGVRVTSVRQARGDRLWTRAPPERPTARAQAGEKARKRRAGSAPARLSIAASGRRGGPAP
jgi:competence protein ComEC